MVISGRHKGNDNAAIIMSTIWDRFSPPQARTEHRDFLLKIAREEAKNRGIKIFDAALGTALDAIPLIKAGFDVTGNEADENYLKAAMHKLKKGRIRMDVVSFDWLGLDKYKPNNLFDIVLCVGNNICYLFGREAQRRAVGNFFRLVKKGGILVIDERNFQFLLDHREEILSRKEKTISEHKGLSRHILYGGKTYYPYPVAISEELVDMGLWKGGLPKPISHFYFYPFKEGELQKLLEEFFDRKKIEVYSDYERGRKRGAGFYQYVCRK